MDSVDFKRMRFKSPQQKAVVSTQVTANFLSSKLNKFMAEFDLSMAQFNILRILRGANEALTISTIKERMIEKSPNTTRLLDKLLEKQLIQKNCCKEDRRQFFVEITEEGLLLLEKIDKSGFESIVAPVGFTVEDAEALNILLDKLRSSF